MDRSELLLVYEAMPPGTAEARHVHEHARQAFYVLTGRLDIEAAGEVHALEGGAGLEIPPGVPHQVFNRTSGETTFLAVSHPSTKSDRRPVR